MISVETPRLSLSCEDVKALEEAFGENESRFCDCTKWNTLLWGEYLSLSLLATARGKVLQREMMDGTPTYTALFPHTSTSETVAFLRLLAKGNGHPLTLFPLTAKEKDGLLAAYPEAVARTSPDWSDYLYSLSSLALFKGKKYNGQRNHFNRFHANYPDSACLPIDDTTRVATLAFLEAFYREATLSPAVLAEQKQLFRLVESHPLDGRDGLFGRVVMAEGRAVAMAMAERVGDTLYVHAEKALRDCRGAYQAIVSGMASLFLDTAVCFVNREEDDGNEGLRTSKLSYHPVEILEKWCVTFPPIP